MVETAPPFSSTFISMEEFEKDFPEEFGNGNSKTPTTSTQVTTITAPTTVAKAPETVNWVGLLMEYAAQKGNTPPAFSDLPQCGSLEPRFVCTVKIDEREEPFGDNFQTFARKKQAKAYACQCAMEWLSEKGYIAPARIPRQPPPMTVVPGASVASQVPEMCHSLGLTPPAYRMTSDPAAPMVWSGYAVFPLNPAIEGKVAEFSNVHGKKNAREECAKRVMAFLRDFQKRQKTGTLSVTLG